MSAVQQAEAGVPVKELARKQGVSPNTVYRWRNKFSCLGRTELERLRSLEAENRNLKKLLAVLSLDEHMLQEVLRETL